MTALRGPPRQLAAAEAVTLGWTVLALALLALGVAAAWWARKQRLQTRKVQKDEPAPAKKLRMWLSESSDEVATYEQFMTHYEKMEEKVAEHVKSTELLKMQNETLKMQNDSLLRNLPGIVSAVSQSTTPPSDSMTPKTSSEDMERIDMDDEKDESPAPPPAAVPPPPSVEPARLPSPRACDAQGAPDVPVTPEPTRKRIPPQLRPTERQIAQEAATTFTPLFEERGLSTPRTLMELVSSHRLTKESLNQRITKRKEQRVLQDAQIVKLEASLADEVAKTQAVARALEGYRLASPRSLPAKLEELLEVHTSSVGEFGKVARNKAEQAERYFAYAYRLQSQLDDLMGQPDAKSPAGILMRPQGPLPPVALGPLSLPMEKDLSNFSVNFYRVDSWPIEPNARGGRASGELSLPALSESDEEESAWSGASSPTSDSDAADAPAPVPPTPEPASPPDAPAPMLPRGPVDTLPPLVA